MASYRVHTIGALVGFAGFLGAVLWLTSLDLTWRTGLLCLAVSLMAALFPDVDTNSKGQTLFYGIFFVLDMWLIATRQYGYAALLGLLAMLPVLGKHRGWTHTYWAMFLVPLPILLLPSLILGTHLSKLWPYYASAVVGYFSHLAIDKMR